MKRIHLAFRILTGRPLVGSRLGETVYLDREAEGSWDYTKTGPFELVFNGDIEDGPPEEVFQDKRFRVLMFPEKEPGKNGRPDRWLVLELRGHMKWHHLMTLHEGNLGTMLKVLSDVAENLAGSRKGGGPAGMPSYHAEMKVRPNRRRETLSVDVLDNFVGGGPKLSVQLRLDTDDEHMDGSWPVADMSPADARRLAVYLSEAADAVDQDGHGGGPLLLGAGCYSMPKMDKVIAVFIHGNAIGIIIQPDGFSEYFAEHELPDVWEVRIGKLEPKAGDDAGPPKEEYDKVVADVREFLAGHGIHIAFDPYGKKPRKKRGKKKTQTHIPDWLKLPRQ